MRRSPSFFLILFSFCAASPAATDEGATGFMGGFWLFLALLYVLVCVFFLLALCKAGAEPVGKLEEDVPADWLR